MAKKKKCLTYEQFEKLEKGAEVIMDTKPIHKRTIKELKLCIQVMKLHISSGYALIDNPYNGYKDRCTHYDWRG